MRLIPKRLSILILLFALLPISLFAQEEQYILNAAHGVLERIVPEQVEEFELALIPQDNGRDVFEIESRDGKIILRGNNGVSICSALNWYLKYYCNACVSLQGVQLNLPTPLPGVNPKIRQVSPHKYRYFFNYCCFGYSLAWWDWQQWEFIIDWMALNGINLPLAVTGQESTWQKVLTDYGFDKDSVFDFLAGPPYLPFGWMGCLDGWGGPLTQDWIDRRAALQQKILKRERSLGMTPVLQGFTGHIPKALGDKIPGIKLHKIRWIEWETYFVDPNDSMFMEIGKRFQQKQIEEFGTDHFYASDTFIEMTPPSDDPAFLKKMGQLVFSNLRSADPKAIWVMQAWIFFNNSKFWKPPQTEALFSGVPDNGMLVLDLYCDNTPVWKITNSFHGKPWLWCALHNFGNTVFLHGSLPNLNNELFSTMSNPEKGNLSGIGMTQEGLDYNPVIFDFVLEMTWRDAAVDIDKWIDQYAIRRYGQSNPHAQKAWRILRNTVYDKTGRERSIINRRPAISLGANTDKQELLELLKAWDHLIQCSDRFINVDSFHFDLVNLGRQILSNFCTLQYQELIKAYKAKDQQKLLSLSNDMLQTMQDMDRLLSSRQEFLLGDWIESAKQWGNSDKEKQTYEWNARNIITLWGDGKSTLHDYARKEWSGLIADFYLKRWNYFLDELIQSLESNQPLDEKKIIGHLQNWEEEWTRNTKPFPSKPTGEPVRISKTMYQKYHEKIKNHSRLR